MRPVAFSATIFFVFRMWQKVRIRLQPYLIYHIVFTDTFYSAAHPVSIARYLELTKSVAVL